ncbi:hypothetical protein [Pseudomonas sp. R4-39-08]
MRYGLAARYLRAIDEIRDLHGLPEDEPRHQISPLVFVGRF